MTFIFIINSPLIVINLMITIIITIFISVLKKISVHFIFQQIYLLYGLWFSAVSRLTIKLDNMIDSIQMVLTHHEAIILRNRVLRYYIKIIKELRRRRIRNRIDFLIKDYSLTSEMISKFNSISSYFIFSITLTTGITNACLIYTGIQVELFTL